MKVLIYKLFAYRFFGEFAPIVPFAAIYFADVGLSLSQISWLFFAWAASIVIFEVPAGILADRVNRKTILIFSRVAKLLCFAVWFFEPTFIGFLIGYIFWGLGTALDSGAFQAFLYEKLRQYGAKDRFARIYGKAATASFLGLFFSALLGGLLVQYSFVWLIGISVASLAVSTLLIASVARDQEKISEPAERFSFSIFRQDLRYVFTHSILFIVVSVGIVAGGVKGSLEEYQSLFLENKDVALALIGVFIASLEIIKAFGSYVAGHLPGAIKYQSLYLGLMGICFIFAALVPSMYAVIFLALLIFIDVVLWVHNDTSIQYIATDANRATLASFKNFGIELCAVAVFGLVAVFGSTLSTSSLYMVGGFVLLAISATTFFGLLYKKERAG